MDEKEQFEVELEQEIEEEAEERVAVERVIVAEEERINRFGHQDVASNEAKPEPIVTTTNGNNTNVDKI